MRRVVGLIMSGLGAFLVVFAAVEFLVLAGQAEKFPLNEYQVVTLAGRNVTYFSPALLQEFTRVHLRATQTIEGDVAAGTPARAVWNEFTYAYDQTHATAYQTSTERLAFDRRTGVVTNCCGAAVGTKRTADWSGQGFAWPPGTQQRTYLVFDPTLRRPEPARYAGTATIGGLAADEFVEHVTATRFGTQTLPGPLVGMKAQASVTLGEYYQTTTRFWVDPVTGQLVDTAQDEQLTLRNSAGHQLLELYGGDLTMQPPSVAALVASARQRGRLVTLATTTVPVAAGLAGIVFLAAGSVLARRRSDPGEPDAADEPHAIGTHAELTPRAR
jgi:hypothetical protein